MIAIESKRRKRENILKRYPDAVIADVTSHRRICEVKSVLPTRRNPRFIQRGLHSNVRLLNKFYNEGSCATVAAAWQTNDDECRWIAYGDSVVSHYNRHTGLLEHSFPRLADFSNL